MRFITKAGDEIASGSRKRSRWYWEPPDWDGRPDNRVEFIMLAPPLDFDRVLKKRLKEPIPPSKGFARNNDGSVLLDDKRAPVQLQNFNDVEYIRATEDFNRMLMTGFIWESISRDNDFGEVPEEPKNDSDVDDWRIFYKKVWDTFIDAGFTLGDMMKVQKEVMALQGLSEEEVDLIKNE